MKSRIELFFCSAVEDELFRKKLEMQLRTFQRYGLIDALWSSRNIVPGAEVEREIDRYLNVSQIILLLVSPSFLSSDDCYKIMLRAMDRHEKGDARVIPIILRPVDWKRAPFGKLKALPPNEKPITSRSNVDAALYDVAIGIRQAIEQWTGEAIPNLPTEVRKTSSTVVDHNTAKEFSFALVRTLVEHLGPVASVAFSSDGQLLISDSWDSTIKIWNKDAGSVLYTLKDHAQTVYTVNFSPNMSIIVSGSDDCTVRIWDTQTRRELQALTGHSGPVSSVALSADSKMLVSGSHDGTIKVWDTQSGQEKLTLVGHQGPVSSVVLGSDLRTVVSGGYDKTIKVWDLQSGREQRTLMGHTGPVSSIALSADTRVLVSGSHDKTIKLWDMATAQLLKELTGHAEAVLSVAFHPDGNIIASGSLDKTIKIWQKPPTSTNRGLITPLPISHPVSPKRHRFFVEQVCPACSKEFYPGDCDIVSSMSEQQVLKYAPRYGLKRFFARVWPKSLDAPSYLRYQARRQCPSCKYLLPHNIERVRNISIFVVGAHGSGKSHYLAALVQQMHQEWLWKETGHIRLTCLTPEVGDIFREHYLTPLFIDGHILPSTTPANQILEEPLILNVKIEKYHKIHPKEFNLVFYDIASVDIRDRKQLSLQNSHLFHASGIIFLADPMAMTGILTRLPHHLQPSTPIEPRSNSEVLSQLKDILRQRFRSDFKEKLPVPIAMVLSKSDMLEYINPLGVIRIRGASPFKGAFDLNDLSEVDQEVRSILTMHGEENLVNYSTHTFSSAQFFATSATGHPLDQNSVFRQLAEPRRCLDPLLWLLYRLNIIEPANFKAISCRKRH